MKGWFIDNHKGIIKILLFIFLTYAPIFIHLDNLPIRKWDESRLAINAYEMNKNGNYLIPHYEGKSEMWSTKPPLMIWLQVLCIKMLGVNELAVRLPSAIAAFLTCLLIMIFSIKILHSYWLGLLSVIVMITCHGYINLHATRTGDYDALLTLFTTFYILCFFAGTQAFDNKKREKYVYLFFLGLTLAVLTKGIAGLMYTPALLIYAAIKKQGLWFIKNKSFYVGIVGFLFFSLGYYFLREAYNPGYLKAVWENELGGRYIEVNEGHTAGFGFYITNFINFQLSKWYLLLPCGMLLGFFLKDKVWKDLAIYLTISSLFFLLVISCAQTKLEWYDLPLYPLFSLLIGFILYWLFDILHQDFFYKKLNYKIIPYLVIFLICSEPYSAIINKVYKPQEYGWEKESYQIGYYLRDAVRNNKNLTGYFLVDNGYYAQNLFYVNLLNDKGMHLSYKDWKSLKSKDIAIAHQYEVEKYIEENYVYEVVEEKENVKIYKILNTNS